MKVDSDMSAAGSPTVRFARAGQDQSIIWQSRADALKRLEKLAAQCIEVPLDTALAADQYMVSARHAFGWEQFVAQGPEPSFHAVAHDCASDFLGNRDPEPNRCIAIVPVANKKDKSGHDGPVAAICSKKVASLAKWRHTER